MAIVNYESDSDNSNHSDVEAVVTKKQRIDSGKKLHIDETTFNYNLLSQERRVNASAKQRAKELKKKRKGGPWGGYSDDEEEQEHQEEPESESESEPEPEPAPTQEEPSTVTTKFVGPNQFDYLGRTYMHAPSLPTPTTCFTPKTIIHSFAAHDHGINKLALLPKSGHLLLSCGNDSLIKLWSVETHQLLRIFMGHSASVKDIVFNFDGSKFLSCGYDRLVNLWNTETGEILHSFKLSSLPQALLFHGQEFLVGLSNNKIEHYNLQGTLLQTYDHHQGGINTLVHITNNIFMSTSDDKTVRMWNYGINIPIKTISSHLQHAMPAGAVHPTANYIALQSMDNTIRVIHSTGKYKYKKSKTFTGHHCSGYGIDIAISQDGRIIMSGDSKGYAYFWDWKTGNLVNRIKCSDKVVKCIVMHPKQKSMVYVGGESGEVYICD
ncbi:uncharacterized protein SPAPADRAFT_139731 [Spathaspora passalidarum NRRL Y-27907]|uniref:Uncharacterized protein n=1 Tax=Spathaspora passalidarum (strain NRRL Y-27907 / 11-Y1) TaxID=619300 RepID=G3ANM1_SPAPN|nr:uncharacterized protein SPAPADRAFT_139731 [Spathaspora passalidarum NRRL Y-27907]EGW32550.1 hypothetical protein SPAPADRAFT_139731 [Spathaspora passalidarum NRRL Y-27907]